MQIWNPCSNTVFLPSSVVLYLSPLFYRCHVTICFREEGDVFIFRKWLSSGHWFISQEQSRGYPNISLWSQRIVFPHNKKDRKTYFILSHTKYKVKYLMLEWIFKNLLYKEDNFKINMCLYMLIPWISLIPLIKRQVFRRKRKKTSILLKRSYLTQYFHYHFHPIMRDTPMNLYDQTHSTQCRMNKLIVDIICILI